MINEDSNPKEALNLQDLLADEQTDILSEYLSLSIENIGADTKVSVTTVEDNPTTYSSTISGVSFTDLQYLVDSNIDPVSE
ncbi:MAG: type I secretion C-terminal target domain-containing protein [Methyloprofundus sp.]|nr:type I secretion C-terminal target domain-containing protein [Methyloprofundus sp.]MDT8424542.1 type I secretion C-terminal target domain-containing protein [Methyloprofundus sp.]